MFLNSSKNIKNIFTYMNKNKDNEQIILNNTNNKEIQIFLGYSRSNGKAKYCEYRAIGSSYSGKKII